MMQPQPIPAAPVPATRPRVVPVTALARPPRASHVGGAHFAFDGMSPGIPGYLEFGPLVLAALEHMPGDAPGYAMHSHDNVELLTLVFEGAIAHRDSFGEDGRLVAGEVQAISAGRGIEHEELVADGAPVFALEILLRPRTRDATPRRRHGHFPRAVGQGFVALASGRADAPASALPIDQDAAVSAARMAAGERQAYRLGTGRRAYLLSIHAPITVDGAQAAPGERVLIEHGGALTIDAKGETEVVLLDLP